MNSKKQRKKFGELGRAACFDSALPSGLMGAYPESPLISEAGIKSAKLVLEANDGSVFELIELIENWKSLTGRDLQPDNRIEPNEECESLVERAVRLLAARRSRYAVLPRELRIGPVMTMLLTLYVESSAKRSVSTKAICLTSGCPDTTALRHLVKLEDRGLVWRRREEKDHRVVLVELTEMGEETVRQILSARGA